MGWLFLGVAVLERVRGRRLAAARSAGGARLVSRHRSARPAAGRRRRHRGAAPDLARLPMAVLGDDRARPRDVGARPDRVGRRRTDARPRHVAGVARGVRAVRQRRAAVRAARAAAPRRPRAARRHHRRRHRRPRGRHRLSLFVLRHRADVDLAADRVGAAAGAGRRRHGRGDVRRAADRLARHLPPPDARRARQLRHADDQQRRSGPGRVSHARSSTTSPGSCRSRSSRGRRRWRRPRREATPPTAKTRSCRGRGPG